MTRLGNSLKDSQRLDVDANIDFFNKWVTQDSSGITRDCYHCPADYMEIRETGSKMAFLGAFLAKGSAG